MAMHQQFQQRNQEQQSKLFRNSYYIDGQIAPLISYFDGPNLPDHSHHPPYIPPFHVIGLAPGTVPTEEGIDGGVELQWDDGLELKTKRLKEQDFLENKSQISSSVDFLQSRTVSTGLGLSLDNGRLSSSGDSPFLGIIHDDIDRELQRQEAEIDRFLKVQGERLRQEVLEKVWEHQRQAISYVEEKVLEKLHEKEVEVGNINKKNTELEFQVEQLAVEASAWQQWAKYNENMINALKFNLQQVYAQSRDSKEGCGDSEVDDTAACCNGRSIDFHLLCKENSDGRGLMTCKVCKVNKVCMLLLPCKHLCLCKECEIKSSLCPMCQSSKLMGFEVYM
ncbi:RING-type E3 ubiquitin transferase [Sarracenia purpurea var. burkii]